MSILLDSLRKSEAQRKKGDAPSIYSTQGHGAEPARSQQWLVLLMMGLTAVAITWFGWRQYAEPGDAFSQSPPAESRLAPAESAEVDSRQPPEGQSPSARQEPRTPVESLAQTEESATPHTERDAPPDEGPADSAAQRIAGYVADESSEPIADPAFEAAKAETELPADAIDELARVEREAPGRSAGEEAGTETGDEPRSYWHLPQSWRSEMPELKITVLVYAEAPEDRFLLINGERLQEGEELDGGVILEEIRRDGAVFTYRSQRFLVKS